MAAMAELSGANNPGAVTIILWLSVAVLAFALPVVVLLVERRQTRHRQASDALAEVQRHFVTRGRGVTPHRFASSGTSRDGSKLCGSSQPGLRKRHLATTGPGL